MMARDETFSIADAASDDRALPFQVEGLDVRGRVVTLGPSLDAILQRHEFPLPVKRLVGEAAVLASLLATSLKDVGRFILQTQTDGRRGRPHAWANPGHCLLQRGGDRGSRR
jgi:molecular chaperone Hsp33